MSDRSLEQWLQFLESLHPSEIELGLERVSAVAARLDLLEFSCPVVTVAGTNGKGTTVAVLEALLLQSGRRVGCFTSPHLLRFNERIRLAGEEATDQQICDAFSAIDAARDEVSLTYFEFATLAALWVFRACCAEVIVLEVGLGGRLDATNILDPNIAVVTAIALDHQQWLGDTRDLIAREKAGILRSDVPAIIADPMPPSALLSHARDLGASPVLRYGQEFSMSDDIEGGLFELVGADHSKVKLRLPNRPELLPQNVCAALQAACLLDLLPDADHCRELLSRISVPGRRESTQVAGLNYVLDVAHNPAAAVALSDYLSATPCSGRTLAVFSAMADKDIVGIVEPLAGQIDAWFLADQPDNPRAATAGDLATTLRSIGETMISVSRNLRQAFGRARQLMSGEDRLVVFGSFFTVAAVMPVLEKERRRMLAGVAS